jgi:hypothetical protein
MWRIARLSVQRARSQDSAVIVMQRQTRRFLAQRREERMQQEQQELRDAAALIQARWIGVPTPEKQNWKRALAKIQAVAKGHQAREHVKRERNDLLEAEAASRARLMGECSAIVEKRGRRFGLGGYEFVFWHERFVFANEEALVYRVRPRARHAQRTRPRCATPHVAP